MTRGPATTTGLVAYLDPEPVGWVAVEPRTAYPRLPKVRTVWSGRQEDKADDNVWAVTCFVTRKGYRKRGITYALAAATVGYARDQGARALEAYPMITSTRARRSPGASCTSEAARSSPTRASPR